LHAARFGCHCRELGGDTVCGYGTACSGPGDRRQSPEHMPFACQDPLLGVLQAP
jgi:hypothetical protein